ncbi:MAG: hypothetical protein M1133_06145 [Armatimonadetes bacterium]|nr:hypothetical protein [Armatimonadota bacterium]
MAKSLKSFWLACEKLASAGVMREWEKEVRDADILAAATRLIAPTDHMAQNYPCINEHWCACSHEVVNHRDGTIVAICTCDDGECDPIPVTKDDLTVYEMDHLKILGGIARAAGLTLIEPVRVDIHEPVHFADLDVGGKLIAAYFAMTGCGCLNRERLISLLVGSYEPFILFTLSPFDFHINSPNPLYRDSRLAICLADLFTTDDGKIRVEHRLGKLVADFGRKAQGFAKAQAVREAHSESVFEPSNEYHTIVLRGKELPHLTDLQADVARILHQAHLRGQRDVKYAVISCEIADLHADERGFEPPSKMSQIFRGGDPRSDLVASSKPGFHRLNI